MIKVLETNLNFERRKGINSSINKITHRLNSIKENIQTNPKGYDLDNLIDILTQIYDDIGDFCITINDETVEQNSR